MPRLRHTVTGVQVLVPSDKADRLIAEGTYAAVPDDERPPPGVGERKPVPKSSRQNRGRTSIGASISAAVEPQYRAAQYGHQ